MYAYIYTSHSYIYIYIYIYIIKQLYISHLHQDAGRRVLVAGASPQRTLFFDLADIILPGDILTSKAHQVLFF